MSKRQGKAIESNDAIHLSAELGEKGSSAAAFAASSSPDDQPRATRRSARRTPQSLYDLRHRLDRPDLVTGGPGRFGFFLEYDRGTERAHEYAAKIAAYYRYRDRGFAAVEYARSPSVLVVTTSEAAELRFAHEAHVASEKYAGNPIPILLTRTDLIGANHDGILGPIWGTPGRYGEHSIRGCWLPGGRSNGSLSAMRRSTSRGDP